MTELKHDDACGASRSDAGLAAGSCEVTANEICTMQRFGDEPMQCAFSRLLKDKGVPMVGMIFPQLDSRYVLERTQNFETGSEVFRWWPREANTK